MPTPYMGELKLLPITFAPKGWAMCNGQLLPINQNQALFSLLGTAYGGNGQTTFALPDLRGRVPLHAGSDISWGQAAGAEAVTINVQELPTHTHLLVADRSSSGLTNANVPDHDRRLGPSSPGSIYGAPRNLAPMHPGMVASVGGSQPHTNMQPYLTLTWCIALQGVFPSRN
jgi:microcystin-dependent protein